MEQLHLGETALCELDFMGYFGNFAVIGRGKNLALANRTIFMPIPFKLELEKKGIGQERYRSTSLGYLYISVYSWALSGAKMTSRWCNTAKKGWFSRKKSSQPSERFVLVEDGIQVEGSFWCADHSAMQIEGHSLICCPPESLPFPPKKPSPSLSTQLWQFGEWPEGLVVSWEIRQTTPKEVGMPGQIVNKPTSKQIPRVGWFQCGYEAIGSSSKSCLMYFFLLRTI